MGKGSFADRRADRISQAPGPGGRQRERTPLTAASARVRSPVSNHTQPTFADRHIGPDSDAVATMLDVIGVASLEELAAKALPAGILDALNADGLAPGLDQLPAAAGEHEALAELRALADTNTVAVSMI